MTAATSVLPSKEPNSSARRSRGGLRTNAGTGFSAPTEPAYADVHTSRYVAVQHAEHDSPMASNNGHKFSSTTTIPASRSTIAR